MAKVAFIGLGVMGYPMARHLAQRGGHDLTVYNRTSTKAEKWVAEYGGRRAPTEANPTPPDPTAPRCGAAGPRQVQHLVMPHRGQRRGPPRWHGQHRLRAGASW